MILFKNNNFYKKLFIPKQFEAVSDCSTLFKTVSNSFKLSQSPSFEAHLGITATF